MTPSQLSDVFAFVEATGRTVVSMRVNPEEFEPITRQPMFQANTEGVGPAGTIFGAPVSYDATMPVRQFSISGRLPTRGMEPEILDFLLDLAPQVRLHREPVDLESFAQLARDFETKLQDLRDHPALYGHRDFTVLGDGKHRGPGDYINGFRISCVTDSSSCQRTWAFNEDEIAAAGHPDLTNIHGWAVLVESAKLVPSRERPNAWAHIDRMGDDDGG